MAQKSNIVLDQGTTFLTSFTLTGDDGGILDLTSQTGKAQMRKYFTSNNYYSFTVNTSNVGVITLSMDAATTSTIPAGRYVYDVDLVDAANNISRVVEGIVSVTPSVTR